MLEAIFYIMNDADSLDLIIQSYQLLVELDKVLAFLFYFLNFFICVCAVHCCHIEGQFV